jgi:hypothetical protein
MASLKNVLMRIGAAFAASALGVIGAGAIAGISVGKAMLIAGLSAVAAVVATWARAFMDDGKLTLDEINASFSSGNKTVPYVEVEKCQAKDAETNPAKEDDPNYN